MRGRQSFPKPLLTSSHHFQPFPAFLLEQHAQSWKSMKGIWHSQVIPLLPGNVFKIWLRNLDINQVKAKSLSGSSWAWSMMTWVHENYGMESNRIQSCLKLSQCSWASWKPSRNCLWSFSLARSEFYFTVHKNRCAWCCWCQATMYSMTPDCLGNHAAKQSCLTEAEGEAISQDYPKC